MSNTLNFRIEPLFGWPSIVPHVDGTSLPNLVSAYEARNCYAPTGNYGGLPAYGFAYGPLEPYFLGQAADDFWTEIGGIYLLGCLHCGEVGCWPLVAEVKCSTDHVVWTRFQQPHRPERDYARFGPFVFEKQSYLEQIRILTAMLDRSARYI